MGLPFAYPSTPPPWLAEWPTERELQPLFPEGIRRYAYRVLRDSRLLKVDWTDDRLTVAVGDQKCTWRRVRDGWRRQCTCGYTSDCCVHAYVAAHVLHQILKQENWLCRGGAPAPPPPPTPRPPTSRPSELRLHQLELFGAVVDTPPDTPHALEVEVDLHEERGQVNLRFYLRTADGRQLLRLQQVLNLGLRSRHSSAATRLWQERDLRFLAWLAPQIRDHPAVKAMNLLVLSITPEKLNTWLECWADTPGRFIERASQAALTRPGQDARLHIELTAEGEWVRLTAMVTSPAGRRYPLHEVFELLAANRRELVLDGQLLAFEPPFDWDLLCEVFARKPPRLRQEHVCEHLPALISGRLDILAGPAVRHRAVQGQPRIEVTAAGADFLLRPQVGDALIHPGTSVVAGALRPSAAGGFEVVTFEAPELPGIRSLLGSLPLKRTDGGMLRLAGTPENAAALVGAWNALPRTVERVVAAELRDLLGAPLQLRPELSLREGGSFLDLHLRWVGGAGALSDSELREALARRTSVLRSRGGIWLQLDGDAMESARARLSEAGFADETQRLLRPEARHALAELQQALPLVLAGGSKPLADRLLRDAPPIPLPLPTHLDSALRQYQKDGFTFLADRCAHRVGAILADDMGLGKTVQVLAVLEACLRPERDGGPARPPDTRGALVVCPASVVAVWCEQASRFCPRLRCATYTGTAEQRRRTLAEGGWDLLVTNYALVRNDALPLLEHSFAFVILDEAQYIKNPESQISQVVKKLRTPQPLALTGTPIENRLLDLWSIMDFLNPHFLGSKEAFLARYEPPSRRAELSRRLAPLILRRTKDAVAPQLPPRTEETLRIEMGETQRRVYDGELTRARAAVRAKGPIEILAALTRLREVCCHPDLVLGDGSVTESAKLGTLIEMLEELLGEGHSALVFSQFTRMLSLIEPALTASGLPWLKLTGETPTAERARLVQHFNDAEVPLIFLLSLKAAGTGLTLTKADYVFIYDPWWNPAVERQAIDRTHRLGQHRPVVAYRLVAQDTVEEKVLALQAEKAELIAAVMADTERQALPQALTTADLAALIG